MVSWRQKVMLIVLFAARGTLVSQNVTVRPLTADESEGSTVNFTCIYKGIDNWFQWTYQVNNICIYTTDTCKKLLPVSSDRYTCKCSTPLQNEAHLTLQILNITKEDHNTTLFCRVFQSNVYDINASLFVKVPVKTVSITSPSDSNIILEEHKIYPFKCKTSYSRPTPTVNWFLISAGNTIEINATNKNILTSDEQTFVSVTNVLNISFSREQNQAELVCKGSNGEGKEITSRKIKLNITYAPDRGPTIHGVANGSMYKIKENDLGNLSCSISWGNPLPHLSWNCSGNTFSSTIDKQVVSLNLQWETVRDKDEVCVCSSQHSISGIQMAVVTINVLYPTDIPKISVSTDKNDKLIVTELINITEMETINLKCFSKSKPRPSYTWLVNKTHRTDGNVLKLANISRRDAGYYTCYVNNLMNTTFGAAVPGNNSSRMLLNILYPADVGSLSKTSLRESSILNVTCPVIPGNPSTTTIFWTRESDIRRWNSSQLTISNVTRADDTFYTCTVLSKMVPFVGNVIQTVRNCKFHLNVFYSAVVKQFSLIGQESKVYFVVNQTEKVSFICTVEANPASDITIVSPQREQIITQFNINNVGHTFQKTSCENAGEYICAGRNNYTLGGVSSSKLILIVRCPPRPSSGNTNDEKIATAQYVDVILQFTARNYLDLPDKTTFTWFKDNVALERDNRKFGISSNGLQSNLSIKNITQAEFGQYDVRVSNSVGQYIHVYNVMAKDKPEAPKDFTYINDSITDSSVTLRWRPGFDGGYPQTFILLYKRTTEQHWQNESITYIGKNLMNYTLSGLLSEMDYQVKTFARNEEGESAYTVILKFRTEGPVETPVESGSSSTVGVVAGSVSSCGVLVAVLIVVVFIYRKRLKQTNTQNVRKRTRTAFETESSFTYDGLDVSKREGDTYSQLPAAYEQLDNITKEGNTYMEMENTSVKRDDPDYINIRI